MTLIRDYKTAVSIGKKSVDFSLCIAALYIKAFESYSKHLGIYCCIATFLKPPRYVDL